MANNTLAYGFVELANLASDRVTTVGVERVWKAIKASTDEHTRQLNALLASFVERTTDFKKRVMLPGSGTLQPLDADGNPKPVRPEGYYDVAFPIQGGATAWGDNRVTRALMTVEEANRNTLDAIQKDADWVRRHIFGAVFYETSWSFADPLKGSLTIQPLANNDTVTYLRVGGSNSIDDHYLAQAASIDDSNNPFGTIYDELMEHPSNAGGPVVVYVPSNLTDSIESLSAFIEKDDPDIAYGVSTDRVAVPLLDRGFGDEVLGKVNRCWVVEWRALPSSYMLAHAVGGGAVLKMREYDDASLQGFFTEEYDVDGNHKGIRMIRYAGLGCLNRIGAVVYYVGGGSYTEPTGYTAMPLPV